jgi:hypothetical protein
MQEDGSMTEAELHAYNQKEARERPERKALDQRYAYAVDWLETNFNSLTHWRRFVTHVEQIIKTFREEEKAQTPFQGSACMRELHAEKGKATYE